MPRVRQTRGKATDIDAHLGSRLRALREERGLSQEALAERVEISFQQIQKYERGANRMGASRLHSFAQIFKVPVDSFFDGLPACAVDDASARADARNWESFARSQEGRELIQAFSAISDVRLRRQVLQTIRVLGNV